MTKINTDLVMDHYVTIEAITHGEDLIPIISTTLYLTDSESPFYQQDLLFSEALTDFIVAHCIPNNTATPAYKDEMIAILNSLQNVINQKIEEIKNIPEPTPLKKKNTPKDKKEKKSKKK
jgi:hypothetical protein